MLNFISDLPLDDHELCGDGGLIMPTTDIQKTQEILEQAFDTFAVEEGVEIMIGSHRCT